MADHIPLLWDTVLVPPTKRRFGAADTLTFPYNTSSGNIFRFENGTATDRLTLNYLGSLISTPAAPTAPFNAHEINLTSGGLDAETMVGLKVSLTGAGADLNSAPIYALDLNYTSGGGSNLPYGINIDANWDYGLYSLSPISAPILFISETTTPTPVASSGALYTKSDNIPYFQDGAGTEHALAFAAEYASMYLNDNSSATVVETENTPIGLRNFTSGTLSGWTFDAGSTGAITVYADYSGTIAGTVLATAAAHGLSTGDYITIRGTTNYNGLYQITDTDGGHFYFTAAWAGDDGASDFDQASYLEAGSTSAGTYSIEWSLTINMGSETWTEITVIPYKNTTSVPEAVAQMGVGGFDKPTCMSATGFVTSVASGDRIFLAPQYTEIYDIYAVFGSLKLTRV